MKTVISQTGPTFIDDYNLTARILYKDDSQLKGVLDADIDAFLWFRIIWPSRISAAIIVDNVRRECQPNVANTDGMYVSLVNTPNAP